LAEETDANEEEAGGEHPVHHLGLRLHQRIPSASSMSSIRPGATSTPKTTPTRMTQSGGSEKSHQNPCPCGWSSVRRYGWTRAQTIPPRLVVGPSAQTTRARQVLSARFAFS